MSTPATALLIVEDETIIRLDVTMGLRSLGYRVLHASTADRALALLKNHPEIAAAIVDVELAYPVNGLDLAVTIRARWPKRGVVVVSGQSAIRPERLPPGADFLPKPLQMESLQRKLGELGIKPR